MGVGSSGRSASKTRRNLQVIGERLQNPLACIGGERREIRTKEARNGEKTCVF